MNPVSVQTNVSPANRMPHASQRFGKLESQFDNDFVVAFRALKSDSGKMTMLGDKVAAGQYGNETPKQGVTLSELNQRRLSVIQRLAKGFAILSGLTQAAGKEHTRLWEALESWRKADTMVMSSADVLDVTERYIATHLDTDSDGFPKHRPVTAKQALDFLEPDGQADSIRRREILIERIACETDGASREAMLEALKIGFHRLAMSIHPTSKPTDIIDQNELKAVYRKRSTMGQRLHETAKTLLTESDLAFLKPAMDAWYESEKAAWHDGWGIPPSPFSAQSSV